MSVVSNLKSVLAFGMTPGWVDKQFDGKLFTWRSLVPTSYPAQLIEGDPTFTRSQWDSWSPEKRGFEAQKVYQKGYYYLAVDTSDIKITQDLGSLKLGTPIVRTSSEVSVGTSSRENKISTLDLDFPVTTSITLTTQQQISSNTSTTKGLDTTQSFKIGAELEKQFAIAKLKVNAEMTRSTTVNTSESKGTETTTTVGTSISNTLTVQPGYVIEIQMVNDFQEITTPFVAPVKIEGTAYLKDKFANHLQFPSSMSMTVPQIFEQALIHNIPEPLSINNSAGLFNASGEVVNTNAQNFTTQINTIRRPVKPGDSASFNKDSARLLLSNNADQIDLTDALNLDTLGIVTDENGNALPIGASYPKKNSKATGATFPGTNNSDTFHLNGKDQVVYSQGGSDDIYGSQYGDTIYLDGVDGESDSVLARDGDDLIVVQTGSHDIDAGSGDDKVKIKTTGTGVTAVDLGPGSDKLVVDFSGFGDDGADFYVTGFSFKDTVEYLGLDDSHELTVDIIGDSAELFINDKHVATYFSLDYSGLHGSTLEVGLLNYSGVMYKKDFTQSRIIDGIIEYELTGNKLIGDYVELVEDRRSFVRAISHLQEDAFGRESDRLSRWALDNSNDYENMTGLVMGLALEAKELGLDISGSVLGQL